MAYEEALTVVTRNLSSTADFSTRNFHFVTLQTDGDAVLQTSAGGWCLGVAQDATSTALTQGAMPIAVAGISKIWYASSTGSTLSVVIGNALQSHTNGQAIAAAASDNVVGFALTAHSSGAAKALGEMLVVNAGIY